MKKKYWYFVITEECVACGLIRQTKERRYDDKPTEPSQRYEYKQFACDVHFL